MQLGIILKETNPDAFDISDHVIKIEIVQYKLGG
jgi:hypothetical protein